MLGMTISKRNDMPGDKYETGKNGKLRKKTKLRPMDTLRVGNAIFFTHEHNLEMLRWAVNDFVSDFFVD